MIEYIVYLVKRRPHAIVCKEEILGEWNISRDVDTRGRPIDLTNAINTLMDCDDHDRAQLDDDRAQLDSIEEQDRDEQIKKFSP